MQWTQLALNAWNFALSDFLLIQLPEAVYLRLVHQILPYSDTTKHVLLSVQVAITPNQTAEPVNWVVQVPTIWRTLQLEDVYQFVLPTLTITQTLQTTRAWKALAVMQDGFRITALGNVYRLATGLLDISHTPPWKSVFWYAPMIPILLWMEQTKEFALVVVQHKAHTS